MSRELAGFVSGAAGTAWGAFAITPDDDEDLPQLIKAIYVGGAGDVDVIMADGSAALFDSLPVGRHEFAIRRVLNTLTTATNLVGLV